MMNRTRTRAGPAGGTAAPSSRRRLAQMSAWRRSFSAMWRNADARRGSFSIPASASYRTIASRFSLRFSSLWAMFTDRAYRTRPPGSRAVRPLLAPTYTQRAMDDMTDLPPLRYLAEADVIAAMPSLPERLELAELTVRGLAGAAELPPKIGVHPRPEGAFGHAMPAYLPGSDPAGSADLVGMKWVLGHPTNTALGLPGIHATLLLSDPRTGVPIAIMDASPITAERTAAISGVAIRAWAPPVTGRVPRATIIGAGVQGRSHVAVIGHVLPGVELRVFDRDRARADGLAAHAREVYGIATEVAGSAREAVGGADVVVTAASFVPAAERQVMTTDWLAPDTLVVPIDYATYCSAEVARDASLFVVDHRAQFLANRDAGLFDGYPDPAAMIGEALDGSAVAARPRGRVVATNLGTGLADVVLGGAILATAQARGLGQLLPR